MKKIPINDEIIYALAQLVDDAQKERRDPSHSDIDFLIEKYDLEEGDPRRQGNIVGKSKRVRAVLVWANENKPEAAEYFAADLIAMIRSYGGFRKDSPNFVGKEEIANLQEVLKTLGISLGDDGSLAPIALENLSKRSLIEALKIYVNRAKKGIEDAALVVGTSKDLMEAVAIYVLQEIYGTYPKKTNFPTLLGQAFTALNMATPAEKPDKNEHPRRELERKMYELACAINRFRNKEGTGHGRPWLPDLTKEEVKSVVEFIGIISERMLLELEKLKNDFLTNRFSGPG